MIKSRLTRLRHRMSTRLMLATLFFSLIIAVIISSARIYLVYQDGITNAHKQLLQVEASYIPSLKVGLWEVNNAQINVLLDGIAQLPHMGAIQLTDELGITWRRNEKHIKYYPILVKDFPLVYHTPDTQIPLGTLRIELSARDIVDTLKSRAIGIAVSTSIILLLTAGVMFLLFQQWVTRHLEQMAQFARQIDPSNLDRPLVLQRPPRTAKDELDVVVDSINQMQTSLKADLQHRTQIATELREHKNNLEHLVQTRTAELQEKNTLLERQASELEAQNRELDAYAHSVAHDLKTPLTTIVGRSKLLSAVGPTLTPQQAQDSATSIYRTAKKMSDIINALLLLASIRRSDDVITTPIDMQASAREACERLQAQIHAQNAHIEFVGNWQPALGHGQWLEEVWVNYLSNAIKYGGTPAQIEIGCAALANGMNKYWVRDYGAGIHEKHAPGLFVQFSRINATSSDGHGLGLSIVKRIIERLHGDVGYETAIGGGSLFWFTLPMGQ